ncbi:alpha/beta fold hydrolase [Clostridium hydrogenum]|uniref:alpha/beta fold hydrolase n=1 Tax=Clostridium hydrogenum TaxID=2855764 RepID=UPI001F354151|nr:alpha/beta hydrolase [Clostridium hydrogenum]
MLFWRSTCSKNRDKNGVYKLKKLQIGGIKQWILVRGKNRDNPILLFLHGGPGSAQIAVSRAYFSKLEEKFIVVNWDQRGAGLSYSKDIPKNTMTVENFSNDTKELIEYLLNTYNKKKIFLVGHSWGSALGILVTSKYPQLIQAYVGIGQIGDMQENERLAYKYVNEYAHKTNNNKAIKQLQEIGKPPYNDLISYMRIRSKWTGRFKGTFYKLDVKQLVLKLLISSEYTIVDIYKLIKGSTYSIETMLEEVSNLNLLNLVPELSVPVYFLLGKHDYTVPYEAAEKYFDKLIAPFKEIVWFDNSAHCLPFEEPLKFQKIIIDKLTDIKY